MEKENTDQNRTHAPNGAGEASKRSASYPALTPVEAYDFTLKVNSKFSTQEVTRKEIGHALGVHNLSISRDVAAATAYGFLDKSLVKGEKDFKYNVTQLFNDVFKFENDNQKKLAYTMAFGKPKLWRELISKFDGVVIPQELYNTLIKHHNITDSAAKEVADIFLKSGKEVGVINENRVLNYSVSLNTLKKTQYAEVIDEPNDSDHSKNHLPIKNENEFVFPDSLIKVPIHLTKNKMAFMVYPADISNKDIKLLDHAIKGILLRLELEKDEDLEIKKEQ